jgi:hypothetical protein
MTGMDALSPKARALIEGSRAALRARAGDRERIEAALRTRLGSDVLPASENPASFSSAVRLKLVAGAAVGAIMLGGVAVWGLRTGAGAPQPRAAPPLRSPALSAAPSPTPATPTSKAEDAPPAVPPVIASKGGSPRARVPEQDELAREVALLSRATKELRAGEAEKALRTLETHRRRFPNGLLEQERRAAAAQALCMSGRVAEGRAEQLKLEPRSPAASRAKQACDAAAAARDSR